MILLHLQQIVAFCHSRVTKIGSLRAFTAASGIYVNENRESETAGDNNTNAYNSAYANKRVSEIECALVCVQWLQMCDVLLLYREYTIIYIHTIYIVMFIHGILYIIVNI